MVYHLELWIEFDDFVEVLDSSFQIPLLLRKRS